MRTEDVLLKGYILSLIPITRETTATTTGNSEISEKRKTINLGRVVRYHM